MKQVPGMTTNNIENPNSLIWSMLGKSKYHGTWRTDIAVILAITECKEGKEGLCRLLDKLEIPASSDAQAVLLKRDDERKKQLNRRQSEESNRYLSRQKDTKLLN